MINLNFHLDILHFYTEKFNIKQIYYITTCRESGLYLQIFRPVCLYFGYYCGTKSESSIVIDKIVAVGLIDHEYTHILSSFNDEH